MTKQDRAKLQLSYETVIEHLCSLPNPDERLLDKLEARYTEIRLGEALTEQPSQIHDAAEEREIKAAGSPKRGNGKA